MRRKKIFTTTLILLTIFLGLFLTVTNIFTNTIDISESQNEQWDRPIYEFGDQYVLEWPDISTDELSKCIISSDGDVDVEKFKLIFESEFRNSGFDIDYDFITFEYNINGETMNVKVDTNMRMFESEIISNPTKNYSYHLKTNDYSYNI